MCRASRDSDGCLGSSCVAPAAERPGERLAEALKEEALACSLIVFKSRIRSNLSSVTVQHSIYRPFPEEGPLYLCVIRI